MPGLPELLAVLQRRNLPLAIATSSSPEFVRRALRIRRLEDRFRFFLTPDDVKRGKPHPDIYQLAAERHNVPVEHMLVLEDSRNGSLAAAAAGAVTVAVPGSHSANQDFSHVDLVVRSLGSRELLQMIGHEF